MSPCHTTSYPHRIHDHIVSQVREIRAERAERLASIHTQKQALVYRERVQKKIDRAFRPRPRKTALNARITGTVERPTHRIERIGFESRPGCLVTGNLYIPNRLAVSLAKAHPVYALDVRSLSESRPSDDRDFFHP